MTKEELTINLRNGYSLISENKRSKKATKKFEETLEQIRMVLDFSNTKIQTSEKWPAVLNSILEKEKKKYLESFYLNTDNFKTQLKELKVHSGIPHPNWLEQLIVETINTSEEMLDNLEEFKQVEIDEMTNYMIGLTELAIITKYSV